MPDEQDLPLDDRAVPRDMHYPGGFVDFFRTEYRRIVKALMFMEGACLTDADDCVAHAMAKLFERWDIPKSDPGYVRHPRAYALTTAKRQLIRERRRVRAVALDDVEPVLTADEPGLTMLESREYVADILKSLPAGQRQVMCLITEGYTPTDIAGILRKRPNNVRQIAHQAKKQLRPLLEPAETESAQGEEENDG